MAGRIQGNPIKMTASRVSFWLQALTLALIASFLALFFFLGKMAAKPPAADENVQKQVAAALEIENHPGFPAATPAETAFFAKVAPAPLFAGNFPVWESLGRQRQKNCGAECENDFNRAVAAMKTLSPAALAASASSDREPLKERFSNTASFFERVMEANGGVDSALESKSQERSNRKRRRAAEQPCANWAPLYNLGILSLWGDDPALGARYYSGDAIQYLDRAISCLEKSGSREKSALTNYARAHALWRKGGEEERRRAVERFMAANKTARARGGETGDPGPSILNDLMASLLSFNDYHRCSVRPTPSAKPARKPYAAGGNPCEIRDAILYDAKDQVAFEWTPRKADGEGKAGPFAAMWDGFYEKAEKDDAEWACESKLLAYACAVAAKNRLGSYFYCNPFLVSNTALLFCREGRFPEAAFLMDRHHELKGGSTCMPSRDAASAWDPSDRVNDLYRLIHVINGDGARAGAQGSAAGGKSRVRGVYQELYGRRDSISGNGPAWLFAPLGPSLTKAVSEDEADLFLFIGKLKSDLKGKGITQTAAEYARIKDALDEAGVSCDTLALWWEDVLEQVAQRAFDQYEMHKAAGREKDAELLLRYVRLTEGIRDTHAAKKFPIIWGGGWWKAWMCKIAFWLLLLAALPILWWVRALGRAYVLTYIGYHHKSRNAK